MGKHHIDRRVQQMQLEGVDSGVNRHVGETRRPRRDARELGCGNDAVVALGRLGASARSRRTRARARRRSFCDGLLPLQNKRVAGDSNVPPLTASGKHVVVIGAVIPDPTASAPRIVQGASSVTQFELLPSPPSMKTSAAGVALLADEAATSSSHEEGCERDWAVQTKAFKAKVEKSPR